MVTRVSWRTGAFILVLIALWSVAGTALAGNAERHEFQPPRLRHAALHNGLHAIPHPSSLLADDSHSHFSVEIRTVEILPYFASLLAYTYPTQPATEKDPLSLTQRRRE